MDPSTVGVWSRDHLRNDYTFTGPGSTSDPSSGSRPRFRRFGPSGPGASENGQTVTRTVTSLHSHRLKSLRGPIAITTPKERTRVQRDTSVDPRAGQGSWSSHWFLSKDTTPTDQPFHSPTDRNPLKERSRLEIHRGSDPVGEEDPGNRSDTRDTTTPPGLIKPKVNTVGGQLRFWVLSQNLPSIPSSLLFQPICPTKVQSLILVPEPSVRTPSKTEVV